MHRRHFLRTTIALAASGAAIGAYARWIEPHWLELVRRRLPVAGLPPALEGARLVHLSDLHAGWRVSEGYLASALELVSGLAPDIVAVTGDFVTIMRPHRAADHRFAFARLDALLRHLPRGRLATVASLGNHDYGRDWIDAGVAAEVAARVGAAGATVLRNRALEVGGLRIVGIDDLWSGRFDPVAAFAGFDATRATLALSHNPDSVDRPGWERFRGWVLAGHTHGGQVRPPFLPPPVLPVANKRYNAGRIPLAGGRTLYISRGVGHMWQWRFLVRPEVTEFTLVGA